MKRGEMENYEDNAVGPNMDLLLEACVKGKNLS